MRAYYLTRRAFDAIRRRLIAEKGLDDDDLNEGILEGKDPGNVIVPESHPVYVEAVASSRGLEVRL